MPLKKDHQYCYSCLIVDDEPQARRVLRNHISRLDLLDCSGECAHALEAYKFLREESIDVMFLDIQMPQLNGLEFLRSLDHRPKVILTTAYRDFAFEGFELDVADYLLKPISFERFLLSLQKAFRHLPFPSPEITESTLNERPFLYFRVNRKMIKFFFNEILYFESLKDYVRVVTPDQRVMTKLSITALEKMLPANRFLRFHRSFIVNLQHITAFSANHLEVGDKSFTVGRRFKKNWHEAQKGIKNSYFY